MHNRKRVFTSVIALMLCVVTLFTGALAYTIQDATSGYPAPPTKGGGNGSGNPETSYTDPWLVGYRFTCYRSTDWKKVVANGGSTSEVFNSYTMHNEPGIQLGHSINIMLNATDSGGGSRTDYANGYSQTGLKMPHMLANAESTDYYNKITLAQTELATDKQLGGNKLTHSTATSLVLFDYSGSTSGNLNNVDESSSFIFTKPLYSRVDKATDHPENSILNDNLANASPTRPITIYSGYYTWDQWAEGYVNTSPEREEEANNLYTYIYGWQYSSPMSATSHAGKDRADFLTISDIDHPDSRPFNHNPSNIINPNDDNAWVNKNHALIATLCGLEVVYGEYGPGGELTDQQFGIFDYIIVEPIYMYYYFYTRYYTTVSDTAILQADSQREKFEDSTHDCWHVVYHGGYKLFNVCGKFPASYGTYIYTETPYFGVDGVFNATEQRGYERNVWTYKGGGYYHIEHDSVVAASKYTYKNEKGQSVTAAVNPNTHAYVFTNSGGYTMFTGGTNEHAKQQRVWYSGLGSMFIAPQVPVECLLGAGFFMSGPDQDGSLSYEIVYHTNPNSGGMNNAATQSVIFAEGSPQVPILSYDAGLAAGTAPSGKVATNYWTLNSGDNGQGIKDNTINSITTNITKKNGKIEAGTVIDGADKVKEFFETHGVLNGGKVTVHLYAAWNTKSLVTALDRPYSSSSAQSIQQALLQGGHFMGDTDGEVNQLPTVISIVRTNKSNVVQEIIPLVRVVDQNDLGYQWLPQGGNLEDTDSLYYIAYSYSRATFGNTPANRTDAQNAINKNTVSGLQMYRHNNALVEWESDVNLFYFDFYTYDIDAPDCAISVAVTNYPDSDNTLTVNNSANQNSLSLILPRGSSITYTVTPKTGFNFDTASSDFGNLKDWTYGLNGHIKLNPDVVEAMSSNEITKSATLVTRKTTEMLGKHADKYVAESGKALEIVPYLDNQQKLPFNRYYVEIYDVNSGQYYHYTYKTGRTDLADDDTALMDIPDTGIVKQALAGGTGSVYYISVSASNESGRTPMVRVQTVDTTNVPNGSTATVSVHYYTSSVAIKTQSGGNHSPISATMKLHLDGTSSEEAFATLDANRVKASGSDAFCSDKYYSYVSAITLKDKVAVTIERSSSVDWYLTSATNKGAAVTVTGEKYISGEVASGDLYIQSDVRTSTYALNYTFAPYHYITFKLDGKVVDYTTLMNSLSNHTAYTQATGSNTYVNVLRGKYNSNATLYYGITPTKATHNSFSISYNQDAVTHTTLEYFTVTTSADAGYNSTTIKNPSGTSMGSTAYILSNYTNTNIYAACSTGQERISESTIQNNNKYTATATLNTNAKYQDANVQGKLSLSGGSLSGTTTINSNNMQTINPGTSVNFQNVKGVSKIHWNSIQPRYDLKFVFRVNDVPYESLPATIANNISLNGNNNLTFSKEGNQVVAKGTAIAGTHKLYLAGMDTGMSYTVSSNTANNVYYVDFYTLRVAAGTGIQNVSINAKNTNGKWNGTLPYLSFEGKRSATTLVVWPASVKGTTNANINIDATAAAGETFKKWETKRPTSNITITYANGSATTTNTKATTVNVGNMNHATVVQAEARGTTPIIIPNVPEPNSIYYGVRVRTFTDGQLTNPWSSIYAELKLSANETYKDTLTGGQLSWAVCLDEFDKNGNAITNPYKGKSATAILAPSEQFQNNGEITTEYFYSASNAYADNAYTYIDAYYYTQTIQTQVNGVNTPPFALNKYQEVSFKTTYKNSKNNTTESHYVNGAGAYQVVLMKGMKITVNGRIAAGNSGTQNVVTESEITGIHSYIVPYYTVNMHSVCEAKFPAQTITCPDLKFYVTSSNGLDMELVENQNYTVMPGTYTIEAAHSSGTHDDKHNHNATPHTFMGWGIATNEIFKLEYVDSGDGKFPYPVLTYTGEERPSLSKLTSAGNAKTTINVLDETNLTARWIGSDVTKLQQFGLTLHSQLYDVSGKLMSNTNAISMYFTVGGSNKVTVNSGETNYFGQNTSVNVSATLDKQPIYYPTQVSVTTRLIGPCGHTFAYDSSLNKCPTCGTKLALANASTADIPVAYYSTHNTAVKVQQLVRSAEMYEGTAAEEYLAANGVIVMKKTGVGTYTGTIPYSTETYHLYTPQGNTLMQQPASYDIRNDKVTQFEWGAPAAGHTCMATGTTCAHNGFIWCGTPGISGGSTCHTNCQGTASSDFAVTMNGNKVYTVVAHQVTTGSTPSGKSLDYVYCSVYTSTDYKTQLPYNTTNINLNGSVIPLSTADGHNFIIAKGSNVTLSAQIASNGGYKQIFNGTVSGRKTFLLSYNTVTVTGDKNLTVGLTGMDSQRETWLANYAIDGGALQSAGTTYSVFAQGGSITNKTLYQLTSSVLVTTSPGYTMDLVPVPETLNENEEAFGGFKGSSAVYYVYILQNNETNRNALTQYSVVDNAPDGKSYIVGVSTDATIAGQAANRNNYIHFVEDVEYDIIVNWSNYSTRVVASALPGNKFTAAHNGTGYLFDHVPSGKYQVYLEGSLFVTQSSDIISTSGTVSKDNTYLKVETTLKTTTSSGSAFSKWNIATIPGTAKTTYVQGGSTTSTTNNNTNINEVLLTGTVTYNATSTTGAGSTTGSANGTAALKEVVTYKVETYVNGVLMNPTGITQPVLFNGTPITIVDGESDLVPSITFPTVAAKNNVHDNTYTEQYSGSAAISYNTSTRTFRIDYYTVTFGVNNTTLGEILNGPNCTSEPWQGEIIVAKGSKVEKTGASLKIADHVRNASEKDVPNYVVHFSDWTLNASDAVPSTITAKSHFIANFSSDAPDWTVTLYNKSNPYSNLYSLNSTTDGMNKVSGYLIASTYLTGHSKQSTLYPTSANAPGIIQGIYAHDSQGKLYATPDAPKYVSTASSTTNITLNLKGYTSELAHTVQLKNTSTGTTYTCNVAAGTKKATFSNVPNGKYQLYIDGIKYSTPFAYDTHGTECEAFDAIKGVVSTPSYQTEATTGGILYVAPAYTIRNFEISHWSQVYNDRIQGKIEYINGTCTDATCSGYGTHQGHITQNWTQMDPALDPTQIVYFYVCNVCDKGKSANDMYATQSGSWSNKKLTACSNCGSTHIRMKYARLTTPAIDNNLDYYVYSSYKDVKHNPIAITQDVEMAYPVYVQSVVDGSTKLPFSNAQVQLQYTVDGSTWNTMTQPLDSTGKTVFYVPIGTSYRIIGSSRDEWNTTTYTTGGFSMNGNSYTNAGLYMNGSYIGGDGDENNDNAIDQPGTTYYVHYYTVTARTSTGTDLVKIYDANRSHSKQNVTVTSAVYQRGATTYLSAEIADGTSAVSIKLTKDGSIYTGRTVYLSTSSTSNTKSYKLTYNSTTQCYEHSAVPGTSAGTTYYVWANGKYVSGTYTDEYIGVTVLVKPYVAPVKWTGNCKHDTHSQTYKASELCNSSCQTSESEHFATSASPYYHSFTVYHTTSESATATPNAASYTYRYASDHPGEPQNHGYYYNLITSGDAGISATTGTGVYLERAVANIGATKVNSHSDKGRTQITVTLQLDGKLWGGQTVTIGDKPTTEISTGVYQTSYYFPSGTYTVKVSSSNTTLIGTGTVYGQITVSSTRNYTWKYWTDGHVTCSECGAVGNCCGSTACNEQTKVYCSNCHIHVNSSTGKEYSCCTTGDGKHTYSTCPYNPNCTSNTANTSAQSTTVTMRHNSKLHAVTTYKDTFKFTGDNTLSFYTLRVDADAGISNVKINGTTYNPTTTITKHGAHATYGTTFTNELPNRIYTSTKSNTAFVKEVIVQSGKSVTIGTAGIKGAASNHAEATTALSITLTLDGKPYTGRTVTIGGYKATDADNDGIYVTSHEGFVGGKNYSVTVDGRDAGTISVSSTRTYRWYRWDAPWNDVNKCKYHNEVHSTTAFTPTTATSTSVTMNQFKHVVARTEFIDSFVTSNTALNGEKQDNIVDMYTLNINEKLNNSAVDDFPVKVTTPSGTIYIIPDGNNYYVYDANGTKLSNVPYIDSITDGKIAIALQDGDKWSIEVMTEIEDKSNNDAVDSGDITPANSHKYAYTAHSSGTISHTNVTTTINYYTLTVKVMSDGVQAMPSFGKVNNSATNAFNNPVWLDDVVAANDGSADSNGDTDLKPVTDANTVKVYLSGTKYDVDAKTADDDNTGTNNKPGTGYLTNHSNGTITAATTVTVEYFSLSVDHYGGFTGVQINYGGKTHVSATTPSGANSNAIAKAFFLKGTAVNINNTIATNNTWYQWTGSTTSSTRNLSVTMNGTKTQSAWAKTFATVRYYLHDKNEGWYLTNDAYTTALVVINNRDWNSITVNGEPNKYANFDGFRTHYYSDPTAAVNAMRDVVKTGVVTSTFDVVVNASQVGGQSFIDFYYTRNGSHVDPTPDTSTVPPVTSNPYEPTPTPQVPGDWNVDSMQEYVNITYKVDDPTKDGTSYFTHASNNNILAGTDITLVSAPSYSGYQFVGWFLNPMDGSTKSATGLIGTTLDHYLLCENTTVYAVYVGGTDLGITANDIYGTIKTGSEFTTSATIVNHNNLSVTPNTKINAVLSVYVNGVKDNSLTKTLYNVIVPGNGTQLVYTTVNTRNWSSNNQYRLEWSLDFNNSIYVDSDKSNNQSALEQFKPGVAVVYNTARPGYSTDRPYDYDKNINPSTTKNTAFSWEEWTWSQNSSTGVGSFTRVKGNDKMNILLLMTPENESGLRTYKAGEFNMHNYTTRSGYGLSIHRTYDDLTGTWAVKKSHVTVGSNVGRLEVIMTFPEFNYSSTAKQGANSVSQNYVSFIVDSKVGNYFPLTLNKYNDYQTDDINDAFAHYTPMWLPDGEYKPVTHFGGMWTPIGELRATVQQGEFSDNLNRMNHLGVYTNEIIIKGSLYDDLYNNP